MRLLLLIAAATVSASIQAQDREPWPPPVDPELAASIAGCYRIESAPWPDSLVHLPSPERLPEWVELSADRTDLPPPLPRTGSGLSVRYPPQATYFPFAFWLTVRGGVHLGSTAPGSLRITAQPSGPSELAGSVTGSTDIIYDDKPSSGSVPVRLTRMECPAP